MIKVLVTRQATALVLLACLILKEIVMLFCSKAEAGKINNALAQGNVRTVDTGNIVLGGGFRLPDRTADTGAIRLGGGFRLPVRTTDTGAIRLGGGFRLPVRGA
jgi:hypothetical protein